MTHVVVGYPTLSASIELARRMLKIGVDALELQIPFSDPVADGPVIMDANDMALRQGVRVKDCFSTMKHLSATTQTPLYFMGYYNTVFRYGVNKFARDAKLAGARGLIIPDIPPEEEHHEHFLAACKHYHLHRIGVISPASTNTRIIKNSQVSSGFLYCLAHMGVTGSQKQLSPDLIQYLSNVRTLTDLPLAVGFGISSPEHIKALVGHADIAVVGSAIIEHLNQGGIASAIKFIRSLLPGKDSNLDNQIQNLRSYH